MAEFSENLQVLAARAWEELSCCQWCEHRCGANRLARPAGRCGLGSRSYIYKSFLSFSEPLELLPARMIYFSGCNLRCRFCIQAPQSFKVGAGQLVDGAQLARGFCQDSLAGGSIGLVGGEPSLHLHTILKALLECRNAGQPMPALALHTNMYMTPRVLEMLDGLLAWYVVDFKYGNDGCASRIGGARRYMEVLTRNLLQARNQARLLIRHLLLPGHVECCLRPLAQWMASNLPGVPLRLGDSYVPGWASRGQLARAVSAQELQAARALLARLGIPAAQENCAGGTIGALSETLEELSVTIGSDGRVFLHDLPGDLLEAAAAAFPDDQVLRRLWAITKPVKGHQ